MIDSRYKFRAWDVQNKFFGMVTLINYLSETEIEVDYIGHNKEPRKVCPEEVILYQYTGLKDSKGVEIYENDILCLGNFKWLVTYIGCSFYAGKDPLIYWAGTSEIIGTIHENPELLK